MSEGFSNVASPPNSPGFPQNPLPITFSGFETLNTKASRQGIGDQQMAICDGMMPLGPNNLRILPDLGDAIYTADGGRTIKNFSFGNISSTPYCLVSLSDGSLQAVNTTSLAVTEMAPPGTITTFNPAFSQWGSSYIIIVANQTNGYFLWNGSTLFESGSLGPIVTITNAGSDYTSAPTLTVTDVGVAATGDIDFTGSGNPSNGDTITLNGSVWTFVSGSPGANQLAISGTVGVTITLARNTLNASSDPLITVATYSATSGVLGIEYDTNGTVGNGYTLAASAATPSGPNLTGGIDGGGGVVLTGTVTNGSLTAVTVTNPGNGWAAGDPIAVTVTGGGSDDMAAATAVITGASEGVASIVVTNGGTGYSELTYADDGGTGSPTTPCQLRVVGTGGVVTQIVVVNPGVGYGSVPTITITDPSGTPGSGAAAYAILESGQITSVTVDSGGTNYTTLPTMTVVGDGTGAQLSATISAGAINAITVVNPGVGYSEAAIQFSGGNHGASVTVSLMPFGVSGTTVETYSSRVWVGGGTRGIISAPGDDPSDFSVTNGALAFQSTDSFLRVAYSRFIQSNGFIYLFGDSSMNNGSGIQTAGDPALTTFNNLNVDPQIGTPWPDTVQAFGRDIVFANSIGVHVSYGGAVTKVSDMLDGIYKTVPEADWPAGFTPSAAVMTIFGIKVYILLMPIIDQVTGTQVIKCLMWDSKRWWTSPQTGITNGFIASQEINSVLTAYCSPSKTTIKPMFNTPTTADTMTKYLYSKLWSNPGLFMIKRQLQWYVLLNANEDSLAVQATGTITFPSNPSPSDTVTLNGVVWTFVASGATGNQINIEGTVAVTVTSFRNQLNLSTNPLLSVATYTSVSNVLTITYDEGGTVGNAYTLAASAATPSGATLTGGLEGDVIHLAVITENGIGTEVDFECDRVGPIVVGPIAAGEWGAIMGVAVRTVGKDVTFNEFQMFAQIAQSSV